MREGGVEFGEFRLAEGLAVDGLAAAKMLRGGSAGEDGDFRAGVARLAGGAFPGFGEVPVGEAFGGADCCLSRNGV